jgi:hypothetical protein
MKRIILAAIFACSVLTLAAQEGIKVKSRGGKPTISDFAWAYLSSFSDEDEDCNESVNALKQAWISKRDGVPLEEGETLTIDRKNGFVLYESWHEESLLRIEMCYWNEADKKHKLFACCIGGFFDGKYNPGQYDDLVFFRYDNTSKRMVAWEDVGFEVEYSVDGGAYVSYDLPREGKDIVVTKWYDDGPQRKTLKWDGRRFED